MIVYILSKMTFLVKFLLPSLKNYCCMIQPQTILNVADNTGAQKVMCIKILGSNRQYASVGDIIVAVVKVSLGLLFCFKIFIKNLFI